MSSVKVLLEQLALKERGKVTICDNHAVTWTKIFLAFGCIAVANA